MNLQELHSKLSAKPSYVGVARAGSGLCWKMVNREHVLVKDQASDPLLDPVQLVMVGQVSRGGASLKPLGNYNPKFDNLAKAKVSFELEMPADPLFAGDYLRVVTLLRKLEKNALPALECRNLLVDATAHSHVRMVAPLFRAKTDDDDEEDIPEGIIAQDPSDEAYFPTSGNWPMSAEEAEAVGGMQASHVFQPIHVVDVSDHYVHPALFAKRLPGALVQVFFTLRYWSFKSQNFNSFSTQIDHVVVVKEAVRALVSPLPKKRAVRVSAQMNTFVATKRGAESSPTQAGKRQRTEPAEATDGGPVTCHERAIDDIPRETDSGADLDTRKSAARAEMVVGDGLSPAQSASTASARDEVSSGSVEDKLEGPAEVAATIAGKGKRGKARV